MTDSTALASPHAADALISLPQLRMESVGKGRNVAG